jgi:hypothetical protein
MGVPASSMGGVRAALEREMGDGADLLVLDDGARWRGARRGARTGTEAGGGGGEGGGGGGAGEAPQVLKLLD